MFAPTPELGDFYYSVEVGGKVVSEHQERPDVFAISEAHPGQQVKLWQHCVMMTATTSEEDEED